MKADKIMQASEDEEEGGKSLMYKILYRSRGQVVVPTGPAERKKKKK